MSDELPRIRQAMVDGEHTDGDLEWCVEEIERLRLLLQEKRQEAKAAKDAEFSAFMAGLGPSRWEG